MRETGNFRDIFEANSQYSSIQHKEMIVDDRATGAIRYTVYGASDHGLGRSFNGDNIYLDGIYMKSFRFTNYSKGIQICGDSALFAVAGFCRDDSWARKVMEQVDEWRSCLHMRDTGQAKIELLRFSGEKLYPAAGGEECFAALYITERGAAACVRGDGGVFRLKKGVLKDISGRTVEKAAGMSGAVSPANKKDTYVICSAGMLQAIHPEKLAELLSQPGSCAQRVKKAVDIGKMRTESADVSLVMIQAERRHIPIGRRRWIQTGICGVTAAAAAASAYLLLCRSNQAVKPILDPKPSITATAMTEKEIESECESYLSGVELDLEAREKELISYDDLRDQNAYRLLMNSENYASKRQVFLESLEAMHVEISKIRDRIGEIRSDTNIYNRRLAINEWKKKAPQNMLDTLMDQLRQAQEAADQAVWQYQQQLDAETVTRKQQPRQSEVQTAAPAKTQPPKQNLMKTDATAKTQQPKQQEPSQQTTGAPTRGSPSRASESSPNSLND